jgi:hypothetical protein
MNSFCQQTISGEAVRWPRNCFPILFGTLPSAPPVFPHLHYRPFSRPTPIVLVLPPVGSLSSVRESVDTGQLSCTPVGSLDSVSEPMGTDSYLLVPFVFLSKPELSESGLLCLIVVSCLTCSYTQKMEGTYSSETSVDF